SSGGCCSANYRQPYAWVWSFGAGRDEGQVGMNVQAVDVAPERSADITMTVALTMRQMGVLGLPRNYEIFYDALSGSNPELCTELVALGTRPRQEDLDQIGRKYFTQNHDQGIVDNARDTVERQLDDITKILLAERTYLEKYGRILDETAAGLSSR